MTAPNASSGLKLTEEQVRWVSASFTQNTAVQTVCADWRTLRAEHDAKDAEIARLKEENEALFDKWERLDMAHAQLIGMHTAAKAGEARAEARLAAMASVTVEDRRRATHAIALAVQFNDFGRLEENGDWKCTAGQIDLLDRVCRKAADVALEVFVANKTAGGI